MKFSRRKFLKMSMLAGAVAGSGLPASILFPKRAYAFAQSPGIPKFVNGLPGLGPAGANSLGNYIPVATPKSQMFAGHLTDVYHFSARQFTQTLDDKIPGPTTFWGYVQNGGVQKYLGGVIIGHRNRPVLLYMSNGLPNKSIIPTDPTQMTVKLGGGTTMVGDLPVNRITTHVHGGLSPWISDGIPAAWYTPAGQTGPSFMNVPGTNPAPGTATHYYPCQQSSRFMWFHDHGDGITRINAYAGLASAFLMTDDFETQLINNGTLPDLGIPLIFQDKGFVPANIYGFDPTWQWGGPGSLWYPHTYEVPPMPDFSLLPDTYGSGRWEYGPADDENPMIPKPMPTPASIVPEAFFDTTLVNGAPYPVLTLPPKRCRLRALNGAQARFYHLNFYLEGAPGEPDLTRPLSPASNPVIQIGTEGGFLTQPVVLSNGTPCPMLNPYPISNADPTGGASGFCLLLAPAERADLLIDLNGLAGASIIVYNDAPAPFPGGDARNQYFTGNLDLTHFGGAPQTLPGFGPNSSTLMKILVAAGTGDTVPTSTVLAQLTSSLKNAYLSGEQPPLLYFGADKSVPGPVPYTGNVSRYLTLNEDLDAYGRLIQRLGTTTSRSTNNQGLPTWGLGYADHATERPRAGATEVWEIYNLTGDTHPIHFHLVNLQIIQRASFDATTPIFAPIPGTERMPDPNERGWKETMRMNPGEVTTIIAKFDLPVTPFAVPPSPRTGGHEYVWHCHILEHEEHDMMRPLVVI